MVGDTKATVKILTLINDWKTMVVLPLAAPVDERTLKIPTSQGEGEEQGIAKGDPDLFCLRVPSTSLTPTFLCTSELAFQCQGLLLAFCSNVNHLAGLK